jgi:hypothetical protein
MFYSLGREGEGQYDFATHYIYMILYPSVSDGILASEKHL